MIEKIFVFFFGAAIGSFLNVCIHRMPIEGYSLIRPRSHCPNCKKLIFWYDNVPLLSYVILRGRCRFCRQRIRFRYFVVELLTAVMFLLLYSLFGPSYNFFFCALFLCGLIIATFVDIQHKIIPDEISLGGILAGFILRTASGIGISPLTFNPRPLLDSLLGIIVGGGIIFLTGYLFDLIYFKLLKRPAIQGETQSMGDGDVKLLAMIGAFLGWERAILTFFIAPFFGAVIGVINLIAKKDHTIPYGPFLSLGAVLSLFWAGQIIGLFLHLR